MRVRQKMSANCKLRFIVVTIVGVSMLCLSSCRDGGINDGGNPPCINCPFDFRVTDFEPAWSPDGTTIAYVHGDTIPGIYLIEPSGQNKRLWYPSVGASAPSWSPDGEWIAFQDGAQIYKRKLNGDSLTQLTTEGRNFFPSWSPDGRWIAYDSNDESPSGMNFVWIMKADGAQKQRIAYEPSTGEIRMPSWSPVENKIVHIRYLVGVRSSEIFVMDSVGASPSRLTFNSTADSYPKFSPDGTRIAFTSQPPGLASQTQIWVVNSDGSNLKQLTTTRGYTCDWSPDGQWIVFTDSRAANGRLWIMMDDGSDKRQLTFD